MGSTGNGYVPNVQAQLNYLVQWFHEWSEMQRSDFLPILSQQFGHRTYVNGLLPGMEAISTLEDRPPSLFQCRVKLFQEWSENWSQSDKDQFLNHIRCVDAGFMKKFDEVSTSPVKSPTQELEDETIEIQG